VTGQNLRINNKIATLKRTEPDVVVALAATHAVTTSVSEHPPQVRREVAHVAAALATVNADELLFMPEKFDRNLRLRSTDVHRQQFGNESSQFLRH
jgi:hypothetical protein